MSKSYSELIQLQTFEERFMYLKLPGNVGIETFGFDRYLNQSLYNSKDWKQLRRNIIARDLGCDLGIEEYPISGKILIHHINPISENDIIHKNIKVLFSPNNLICVSHKTHNAIHFGDESNLPMIKMVTRKPNDQCPWL